MFLFCGIVDGTAALIVGRGIIGGVIRLTNGATGATGGFGMGAGFAGGMTGTESVGTIGVTASAIGFVANVEGAVNAVEKSGRAIGEVDRTILAAACVGGTMFAGAIGGFVIGCMGIGAAETELAGVVGAASGESDVTGEIFRSGEISKTCVLPTAASAPESSPADPGGFCCGAGMTTPSSSISVYYSWKIKKPRNSRLSMPTLI